MGSTSHDKSLEFEYDYLGRRVEKKVWSNAGYSGSPDTHLRFAYNGMELVTELEIHVKTSPAEERDFVEHHPKRTS